MSCKVKNCRYSNTHVTAGHRCGNCKEYGHGRIECGSVYKLRDISMYLLDQVLYNCTVDGCSHSSSHYTTGHFCRECREMYSNGCTCVASKTVKCPICRVINKITNGDNIAVYGITETCKICMERSISVLLPTCRHLCLCRECLNELSRVDEHSNINIPREQQHVYLDALTSEEYNTAHSILKRQIGKFCIIPAGQGCCWYVKYSSRGYETFFMHGDSWGQYGDDTSDVPLMETFINGYEEVGDELP